MRRATHVIPAREAPESDAGESVTLAFDDRHRRRIRLTDDKGEDFLLDLSEATRMSDGDCLAIEGGGCSVFAVNGLNARSLTCVIPVAVARLGFAGSRRSASDTNRRRWRTTWAASCAH